MFARLRHDLVSALLAVLVFAGLLVAGALAAVHTGWGREQLRGRLEAALDDAFVGDVRIGRVEGSPLGELVIYGALNIQSFQLGVPELLGLIFKNQSVTGFAVAPLLTAESLKTGLAELFELAVSGQLKVTIGGTYPLERAAEAHRALEGRCTIGKVVLVP